MTLTRKPRPASAKSYFEGKLPSRDERRAPGKALRDKVPRESHAEWKESARRSDPIDILVASNTGRLVPIRHARMLTSPFAFLRGSAAVMASSPAVEHLSSGRRQRFASGNELLSMVMRLLRDLDAPDKDQ